jgi:large conductance mechanosensitive channel
MSAAFYSRSHYRLAGLDAQYASRPIALAPNCQHYLRLEAQRVPSFGQTRTGAAIMGMIKEFRDFAIKGNMIDLAIGVIIGAAFGAIVSSLVDDVFMPLIGLIIGGIDFSNLFVVLSNPDNIAVPSIAAAKAAGVATLNIGLFINAVVKFAIIAFVLFLVVKAINRLKRQAATEPVATTPAPTKEEVLLTEIRDALRATPRPLQ